MSQTTQAAAEVAVTLSNLTTNHFLAQLREKVSSQNARLIMDSALVNSGMRIGGDEFLSQLDAKNLCLAMIKQGGPAFKVGQTIYRTIQ